VIGKKIIEKGHVGSQANLKRQASPSSQNHPLGKEGGEFKRQQTKPRVTTSLKRNPGWALSINEKRRL